MPKSPADSLSTIVSQFVDQLTKVIEEAAIARAREAVLAAVGGSSAPSAAARTISAGRPRGGRPAAPVRSTTAKGQKRDPNVIAATTEKLASHIGKHPGQRIEEIAQALGIATKDLALPIKKLIASKRISTKGQKRATRYS